MKNIIKVPKGLDQYVNDFKIHVFEISWLSDEQVSMFKSDFRVVAEFFTQRRKNDGYKPSAIEVKHVDAVLKLLSVFGNVESFDEFVKTGKKEGKDMASFVDEMIHREAGKLAQDMAQNMAQDMAQNMAQDIAQKETAAFIVQKIEQLQNNLKLTLEEVLDALSMSTELYEQIKSQNNI